MKFIILLFLFIVILGMIFSTLMHNSLKFAYVVRQLPVYPTFHADYGYCKHLVLQRWRLFLMDIRHEEPNQWAQHILFWFILIVILIAIFIYVKSYLNNL